MSDEYESFIPDDDDCQEVFGSCEECESDVYEDDAYYVAGELYCGQCYFSLRLAAKARGEKLDDEGDLLAWEKLN